MWVKVLTLLILPLFFLDQTCSLQLSMPVGPTLHRAVLARSTKFGHFSSIFRTRLSKPKKNPSLAASGANRENHEMMILTKQIIEQVATLKIARIASSLFVH
jgi:hypothetical protein